MSVSSNVLTNLLISSHKPLEGLQRSKCPVCKRSRMYFCYTCYKYVEDLNEDTLPKVKLPLPVDIVKHPKELDGKSTAVHAALLAPADVHIYSYPVIPDYTQQKDVLLLFPSSDSHSLSYYSKEKYPRCNGTALKRTFNEICYEGDANTNLPQKKLCSALEENHRTDVETEQIQKTKEQSLDSPILVEPTFTKIVLVDSTWNQVHGITNDERLQGVPRLELSEQTTNYWRHQSRRPTTHLATIEALHSFLKQYHEIFIGKYCGQYDDMLYFFKFFYDMVHKNKESKHANAKRNKSDTLDTIT